MGRTDARALLVIPLLALGGCGSDPAPTAAPAASSSAAASSAPAPPTPAESSASGATPSPTDSVYVEEDPDPTEAPGELSDQGAAYLDEAIGRELEALEASGAKGKTRQAILEKLPEDPNKVVTALRTYSWWSPEAKALYDKAVATMK